MNRRAQGARQPVGRLLNAKDRAHWRLCARVASKASHFYAQSSTFRQPVVP
jgi:hypothetical protein